MMIGTLNDDVSRFYDDTADSCFGLGLHFCGVG